MRRSITALARLTGLIIPLLAACDTPGTTAAHASAVGWGAEQQAAPALDIRFLNVGQGDAVLLRSAGRTALVDAGPSDDIVRRLRVLGVDTIDLLVASHNHADHIGGADAVLDSIPVGFYLDNGFPASTRIQQRVLERVERKGVAYLAPTARTIALGSARLVVLPPPAAGTSQNNRSVGILVEQGGFAALLTGDSEIEQLNVLLSRDSIPDVDVLKAAHHGSRDAVSPAWLARTRPEVAVISAGAGNGYGHPHPTALRYYCAAKRRVFRTDRHGEVRVTVTPEGSYTVTGARAGASGC
ncbi:MAG: MBL fold metallo-hydrolase [Gemmatimonadetes bacterium]|nr:MBL fold metallo-hydrolase [Gemmatimonadota bacterium]